MAFGLRRLGKVAGDVADIAKKKAAAAKKAAKVKKGKEIAKRKAIAKNVAAKKKRDAAGMAKAKKLAQQGMTTAKKRAKAGKPDSPEEILQRKLMIERGIYKPLPKHKAKFNVAKERALADGATPAEAEQVARGIEPRYKGGPKKKAKPVTAKKKRKTPKKMRHPADPNMPSTAALDRGEVKGFPYREAGPKRERWVPKPKPKAAAAPKKKPKPKTAIVQTPKGFVRKKLQKHPKAAAAGGGKKPPNGNGKKVGAAGGRKRSPEEVRKQQAFGKKKEAIAKKYHKELLKLDEMYYKWDMPNAQWKAKRSAMLKKMSDDIDRARPKKK